MFTVVDVFTVVYVHVYRLFNKSCLKTSWELAWFYSVWWPRCDQGESTEVWPRGKDWSATWGREQRCDQGERTVGARRLWSGAVICGLRQQIALVPACLVLKHASLDQLLPSSQHPSVGQHAASFIISTLGSHRGLGLSLWVCMRERERERMNEWVNSILWGLSRRLKVLLHPALAHEGNHYEQRIQWAIVCWVHVHSYKPCWNGSWFGLAVRH